MGLGGVLFEMMGSFMINRERGRGEGLGYTFGFRVGREVMVEINWVTWFLSLVGRRVS